MPQSDVADAEKVWKVHDLADHFGLSDRSIYSLIATGRLHAVKGGRNYLIPDSSVQKYLAGQGAV